MAYERISGPLGAGRSDILAAMLASTIANTVRRKGRKPFAPKNFMPKWRRETQSPEQMLEAVKQINAALGGDVRG